jgi:S-adenosylmethionine/arginine decarboxylase-like enzyme
MQKTLTSWGLLASIDLHGCDPGAIRSPEKIREFARELCSIIKMERHGETLVERFGEGSLEGYSMFQFIETSSITGHFDEIKNRAFIDIFSCKSFDPEMAGNFCKEFFQAKSVRINSIERG